MDREVWQAIVHGVATVRHDLATKPPPPVLKRTLTGTSRQEFDQITGLPSWPSSPVTPALTVTTFPFSSEKPWFPYCVCTTSRVFCIL